ncbi:MFS transporter [Trueperella sp.]|uniref:nitrate/nitrite transporter n=1 Tax=Trueperella sp. TaxID=2699835 RepID=UPI002605E134|nr:MFS transporter [Trueperella sp.]
MSEVGRLDTSGKTLKNWAPERPENWDAKIAWSTLIITTFSMILGFCVWFLVSALAPKLNEIGFDLTKAQLYWLASMPGLAACLFRLLYTFMPQIIGTRKLVGLSSILFTIPMVGWFFAVQNPNTPYWWMLALSFMCGIGGGAFSGYMPSTGMFFPKRIAGTALNLQAGVGNLGMSIIQIVGPILMGTSLFGITWIAPQMDGAGEPIWVYNPAIFFVPWALAAAVLAFCFLKDVPAHANIREQLVFLKNPDTWYMTLLYVMTFGLFSGLSAQFGLLINNNYGPTSAIKLAVAGATYAFLGPLIGSLVRVAWGPLCDRFTGGLWTWVSGEGMAVTLALSAWALMDPHTMGDFHVYLWSSLAMFFFAGIGNAGTFKQMPMIMPKSESGGAIGFTGAIAASGPFLVGVALTLMPASTFYIGAAIFCVICSIVCWVRYARPNAPLRG